jgi:class 3 adenylate cyclase
VLAANEVKDAVADGGFRWSKAGRRRFKGIHGEVGVMRVRRAEEDGDGD